MILQTSQYVNATTKELGTMHRAQKIPITNINKQLTCTLCSGYYVDATTIIECLHSFCRSCIVKYLQTNKYCPVCEVQIHKTKPLLNIRPDKTLQDIVYKLVPRLFQNETQRRKQYYVDNPEGKQSAFEERAEASYQHVLSPDETICLSFNYHGRIGTPRYLQCPAAVSVLHLQKLIRAKYDLSDNHRLDILYNQDTLNTYLTLMDIACIYLWRRKGPLELTYRIYENTTNRIKVDNTELIVSTNNNDWKEVQLRISENGEMSVTGIQDCLDLLDASLDVPKKEEELPKKDVVEIKIPEKIVVKRKTKKELPALKLIKTCAVDNSAQDISATICDSKIEGSANKSTSKKGSMENKKTPLVVNTKVPTKLNKISNNIDNNTQISQDSAQNNMDSDVKCASSTSTNSNFSSTITDTCTTTTNQASTVTSFGTSATAITTTSTSTAAKTGNTTTATSNSAPNCNRVTKLNEIIIKAGLKNDGKRKLDCGVEDEPVKKQAKPSVVANHVLNGPVVKKIEEAVKTVDVKVSETPAPPVVVSESIVGPKIEPVVTTEAPILPPTPKIPPSSIATFTKPSFLNKSFSPVQNNRPGTPITTHKWPSSKPVTPAPPCYMPKPYSPIINVPKPGTSAQINTTQSSMIVNNKVAKSKQSGAPQGYKTLRDPPKAWNPQIARVNVPPKQEPNATDLKNVRPAKFFKMRNNMPRYLGNPASGVKPMYKVHVSPEKDKNVAPKTENSEIKKHSIVKIDPKTLKPISERAPETSSLTNHQDLKINTSSVSIFNPLKLQQSDHRKSPKSPHSPKKSPPAKRDKMNLNYTPPNPFIPNLGSPQVNPNQFLYPTGPGSFASYDPRVMAAYHTLFMQRLPFPPSPLPPGLGGIDMNRKYEHPSAATSPKIQPSSSSSTAPTTKPVKKAKEAKAEKSLQNAVEKLTQNKIKESIRHDETTAKPAECKPNAASGKDDAAKTHEPSNNNNVKVSLAEK